MKKFIGLISAVVCIAAVLTSCKEGVCIIEPIITYNYSIKNLLDESLTISGAAYGSQFSISLDKGETYTYWEGLDDFEKDKIPIADSDSVKFEAKVAGIKKYDADFWKEWKRIDDGPHSARFILDVDRSFFAE